MRRGWMLVLVLGLALGSCKKEEPAPEEPTEEPRDEAVEEAHDDAVSAVIKTGKVDVKACGTAEKNGGEPGDGKLSITFIIEPDGKVSMVKAEQDSVGNEAAKTCAFGVIQAWVFPAHPYGDSIEYTYPFEISSLPPEKPAE